MKMTQRFHISKPLVLCGILSCITLAISVGLQPVWQASVVAHEPLVGSSESSNKGRLKGSVVKQSTEAVNLQSIRPDDINWENNPDFPGVQSAVAIGDPSQIELYVMFGKVAEGVKIPAHTHTDGRITTVISGVMYYGIGETVDDSDFQVFPEGSVIYTPPNTPHVMWARDGEIVTQESGYGPTSLEFVSEP